MNKIFVASLLLISHGLFAQKYIGPEDVDVRDFCMTPGNQYVYTVVGNSVVLYNVFTGDQIDSFSFEGENMIHCIAISPDSTYLIAGTDDGNLLIKDLLESNIVSVKLSEFPVTAIAIYKDQIAAGTFEGELILTDFFGASLRKQKTHQKVVSDLVFNESGSRLFSSGLDGKICITDVIEFEIIDYLIDKISPCRDLAINAEGKYLLAGFDNGKIYRWKIQNDLSCNLTDKYFYRNWITGLAFHKDSEFTWAFCNSSGQVKLITVFNQKYTTKLAGLPTRIEFTYMNNSRLFLLVTVYNGGLLLLRAQDMD